MNSKELKGRLMKRSMRGVRAAVYACVAMLLLSLTGWSGAAEAQTFRGTILGSVTDSAGLAVAGATVTVRNQDTGLVRTMTTTEDGGYSAPELPIGNYSVTVEKSGFKTGVVTGIRLEVSSERRADVALQPGEIAQRVEVSGDTLPQVESTDNTLGGIIESKILTNLPVNGRDYQKLIFLVPGVTGSPDQITDSPGSFGIFSVNGARGRANNFLLDGTDMNDGYRNDPAINEAGVYGTPATILPVEAIAELRVASNFEAEYGRNAGGVINVVTKSGTNQLHGSGLEFFRNTVFNARNYFNPVGQPKQPFHNNQFGGSLGGPIIKDKTFFFVDYEGLREVGGLNYTARVPTTDEINTAIADNGGVVNPVIAKLLARNPWPAANITGFAPFDSANNTFVNTPFFNNVSSAIVKVDHQLNKDNLLTGRYYFGDSTQSFPLGLVGGSLLPGFNVNTPTRVQLVSISYVTTISPSVISEARLGWNRFAEGFFPQDRTFDPSTIGLNTGATGYNFGLPRINVGNFAQIGANNTVPRQRVDTNWHYIDNVSWKAGRHDIKFGYEFRRTSISQIFNDQFRGKIVFGGSLQQSLDAFIAGTPTGGGIQTGDTNRNTFENSHSVYVQDSIHVRKNVTLNLGLRYDYDGLIQEKHGEFTNVIPQGNSLMPVVLGQQRLYQPDYNNFAPRVSIAWDVTGKGRTVLRAGYGVFYDAFSQDAFIGQAPFNSNFDAGVAYSAFGPNPISFASTNTTTIVPGQPVFGFAGPLPDAFGVDQHIRTPYMGNYNLNLQQQIGRRTTFQIGYVGSQGHKLLRTIDINQPTQAQITACDLGTDPLCPGGPQIHDGNVPRGFRGSFNPFFYVNFLQGAANSNYNSLQASWRIDNWHGVTSTVNYTWSHSIDTGSDVFDYVPNVSQPNDSSNPDRSNRGNSNFDVRNRVAWDFIYEFPNRTGNWQRLTNGWGINGILTVQSGQPFHLNFNFEDDFDGSGEFFGRPDVVGPIRYHSNDPNNFLDLTSFAVPCTPTASFSGGASGCVPGTRHFGNLGRNSLVGPHFRQLDFSVFKNTHLTERLNLELRFEAYNILNHPNFSNPYLPLFIADPAQNGIGSDGRMLGAFHLTSTGDVGVGYPFLGSGGSRNLQVALKFSF